MRHAVRRLITIAAIALAAAIPAGAQPLADRVPQDAIMYVGWAGVDAPGAGYAESHLKAVLDASNVRQLLDEAVPRLFDKAAAKSPGSAEAIATFRAILGPVWRHPSALYFGGLDTGNPEAPFPKFALLCDAGAEGKTLAADVTKWLARFPQFPLPYRVEEQDGLVVVAFGNVEVAAKKKPVVAITQRKEFKAAMTRLGKDPLAVVYYDMEGYADQIEQVIANFAPEAARQKWPVIRDAIGVNSLKRVALTAGFDGKDWSTQAIVESPEPRAGFVKALIDAKPLSDEIVKAIPRSATLAVAGHFDAVGLLNAARDMATKIEPATAQNFDQMFENVWNATALDLRADMLDALGDEWAAYTDPAATGEAGALGLTLVNRLRDAPKAERALAKLEGLLNKRFEADLEPKKQALAFRAAKRGDVTLHVLSLPGVAPTWAIKDGNLYVALYPQAVTAAAEHVTTKAASILDNESFQALTKRLGVAARPTAIAFSDLPRTAAGAYPETLMLVRSALGWADLEGAKTPAMTVPPLSKLTPHLTPAGGVAWVDKDGWHMKGLSPFPGSPALGGGGLGAASAAVPLIYVGMAPRQRFVPLPNDLPPPPAPPAPKPIKDDQ